MGPASVFLPPCWAILAGLAVSFMQALSLIPRRAVHLGIRAYQLTLSALAGSHCRHLPSCSAYMDEAIARHGVWAGGWIGVARVLRCHPWGSFGFDPVPERLPSEARWWLPWTYPVYGKQGQSEGSLSAAPGLQ
jgi:uncharacterized protein